MTPVRVGDLVSQLDLIPPSRYRALGRQQAQNACTRAARPRGRVQARREAVAPARGSADVPKAVQRLRELVEAAARPFREPATDRAALKARARELYDVDRAETLEAAAALARQLERWLLEEGKPA